LIRWIELNMEYSLNSKKLTNELSKKIKKENGIYFTPPSCIEKNLNILKEYIIDSDEYDVLEPSCGSGEYIIGLNKIYSKLKITGIEYNETIYNSILDLNSDIVNIICGDYLGLLDGVDSKKYDLIIGNPPYYVLKKGNVDKIYHKYFTGRPNIFILFIIKSLEKLKPGGILSFVLPNSFLNCLYYEKTRDFIVKKYQILNIIECHDKYLETGQETIILIIKKIENIENIKYVININNNIILGVPSNIIKLNELVKNSDTLFSLGFRVSVGNVVWNQCKSILTNDKSKTRLIYSQDISNNQLKYKEYRNLEKKNFIEKTGIRDIMLVINRGYGVGKYQLNYCLIDGSFEYLIENHLICISYIGSLEKIELLKKYEKIIKSLEYKKTLEFIELYFRNNAINTLELSHILPIYDI
jgi:tRNA1(Val) A37 N6-methylase TrmN6